MWAALAAVHTALRDYPVNICVSACHLLVRTLQHLGFEAEMMAACATIFRREDTSTRYADIGRWDRPPRTRADNSTDGHAVVWTESFHRLIDPTIQQDATLAGAGADDPSMAIPAVIRAPDRDWLMHHTPAAPRGPYLITWSVLPDWTYAFDPLLAGRDGELYETAALQLADDALIALRSAGRRRDLRQLDALYPRLSALLAGRATLTAADAAG